MAVSGVPLGYTNTCSEAEKLKLNSVWCSLTLKLNQEKCLKSSAAVEGCVQQHLVNKRNGTASVCY